MKRVAFLLSAVLIFFGAGCQNTSSSTLDSKMDVTIKATRVTVTKFYDGQNGYSISIPGGNSSVCTWTYAGGNAAIPYIETTNAKSATEKHTIHSYGYYDWKASCVDDFGNQYIGVFPSN